MGQCGYRNLLCFVALPVGDLLATCSGELVLFSRRLATVMKTTLPPFKSAEHFNCDFFNLYG